MFSCVMRETETDDVTDDVTSLKSDRIRGAKENPQQPESRMGADF